VPGATISVKVNSREALRGLDALQDRARDLSPAMRDIGEGLLNSLHDRFDERPRGRAPDGSMWARLKQSTRRQRARLGFDAERALIRSGDLRNSFSWEAGRDFVSLGSNSIYAGTHQFGLPAKNVPARPMLGLAGDDVQMRREALSGFLGGAAN